MMLWLVAVAQCPCMHVLVCHIPPPQSSFAQGVLAASQGYRIARQFKTLRLPKGSMQKGQQSKLTVCGLDPLTPLPKIEAWSQGNYQDILNIQMGMCKKCVQCRYRCIMYTDVKMAATGGRPAINTSNPMASFHFVLHVVY